MYVASELVVDNGSGDVDKLQLDELVDIFFGQVIVDSIMILDDQLISSK